MARPLTTAEKIAVLERAYELMERGRRWTKRKFWTTKWVPKKGGGGDELVECYCLEGAIATAAQELGLRRTRTLATADVLTHQTSVQKWVLENTDFKSVINFNDWPHTKWGDVSRAMRGRLAQLRRELKREQTS